MAVIKGNKLLPIIVGVFIVVGVIIITITNKKANTTEPTQEAVAVADLSEEDLALLGIDGDTEKDTVQTLVTLVKSVRKQQVETDQKIKKLSAENEQLKRGVGTGGEYKINPPKSNEPNELEKQVSMLTDKLNSLTTKYANIGSRQNETNAAQSTGGASNNLPIGQGQAANTSETQSVETINWIMPSDQMQIESSGRNDPTFSFPTSFNGNDPLRAKLKGYKDQINQPIGDKDDTQHDKVYTIAANATLTGSVSMTALLGRVPVDGVVNDPYPFKAVIGRDNLMANGIELPHVEGAIVSGTTSGDFVLSCVKGSVKSITFVFDDGRIRTIPDGKNSSKEELGWISDEYGIPCVSGELKTNAQEYLSSIAALSTLGAAADAISQANTTVAQDSNGNLTTMIDGDMGAYALGKGLAGGLKTTVDWFNKRYGQTFDAVYVPPGQTIAIHINKELDIDYFYNARMVDYGVNTHKLGVLD